MFGVLTQHLVHHLYIARVDNALFVQCEKTIHISGIVVSRISHKDTWSALVLKLALDGWSRLDNSNFAKSAKKAGPFRHGMLLRV